jgi:restriction system protein
MSWLNGPMASSPPVGPRFGALHGLPACIEAAQSEIRRSQCAGVKNMVSFGPISSAPMSSGPRWQRSLNAEILIQQEYVSLGDKTAEGVFIKACNLPWEVIANLLRGGNDFVKLLAENPRKFEELIAATYDKEGFEVVLTPRSGDGGRDVIATKSGLFQIRIVDQVKAYSPGTLVTHEHVRSMLGVLSLDPATSKGIITTTSTFQPNVRTSPDFIPFLPTRLQLRDKDDVINLFESLDASKF